MRIDFVDPSLFTLPYDVHLAGALAAEGHEVTLWGRPLRPSETSPEKPIRFEPFFYAWSEGAGQQSRWRLLIKAFEHIWGWMKLIARMCRAPSEIIHLQWTPIPLIDLLAIWRLRRRAPVVLTVHDTVPFQDRPSSRLQLLGTEATIRAADHIIVHGHQSKKTLCQRGHPPEKISVIRHGTTPQKPLPARSPDGSIHLLCFGALKPYKGFDLLLEALDRLPPQQRELYRVRIAGPASDEKYVELLQQRIKVSPLQNQIELTPGFVPEDDVADLFAQTDAVVAPYRFIDASGVLYQALGFGRPVISTPVGLFAEEIIEGKNGFLLHGDPENALTDLLGRIALDPSSLQKLVASPGISSGLSTWQQSAAATIELYRRLRRERGFPDRP